ncbi:hypothetical protein CC86DRAFT_414596 [Ophiobolus disseminans]|uniref:Uncharacterized protein n=1 Tax=Ophiobolus disseminans TaxID=1469910 RepID=A0A6A7AJP5_9PLEO|nr:hypothetical protein CC86DRAFT_414596 [Ophiobolus disseminans]
MADRGRGRGQRAYRGQRGRGGGAGGATSNGQVCLDFRNTGTCKRSNCRFSHDTTEYRPAQRAPKPAKVKETLEQRHAKQSYEAWEVHLGSDPNDAHVMQRLWERALRILNGGDRDCRQELPKDLDTDDEKHKGRQHIAALMSKRVHNGDPDRFIGDCQQFLLTMTYSSILDSLPFMSGDNGTRAILFFQHLCETLVAVHKHDHASTTPDITESTLLAMSTTLRELLKRDSQSQSNADLKALLEALEAAVHVFAPKESTQTSVLVLNNVRIIRDMVTRRSGLLLKDTATTNGTALKLMRTSTTPFSQSIPSDRHDNDKVDISEIVIFPTRDEIMSNAKEFLPFTDPDQPHFLGDSVQRHIDTHFRLFRHDIFRKLKKALAGFMHTLARNKNAINSPGHRLGDLRTHRYEALEAQVTFQLPSEIRRNLPMEQQRWWDESRRFEDGALVSFIWIQGSTVQHIFLTVLTDNGNSRTENTPKHDRQHTAISMRLTTQNKTTLELLLKANVSQARGILLEYPKIMPATFVPILENLQSMQREGIMPFHQWIVPKRHDGPSSAKVYHDVQLPLYARHADLSFPLKKITQDPEDSLSIGSASSCDDDELLKQVESKTYLDRGQYRALIAALTREFAFIQAKFGPVLVVCFTNHALDQFLEHLIDVGVKKVVRVGGQSKSEALESRNLRDLKMAETSTKAEKNMVRNAHTESDDHKSKANGVLQELFLLHKGTGWLNLKSHIQMRYPDVYSQFNDSSRSGLQKVGRHPFDVWSTAGSMSHTTPQPVQYSQPTKSIAKIVCEATLNVNSLSHQERCSLITHWVEEASKAKIIELSEIGTDARDTQIMLDNVRAEPSRRVLRGAHVIGLTTSGLAGRISLLKHVGCKILICEEAGEILEPHMISALLPTIEHCIQIGDHEQLRPTVSNFEDLSLESEEGKLHQLDKSQFERLSVGEAGRPRVPVAQLNVQRRMRPEISTFVRETIYDQLIDHKSTTNLPNVVGMRQNVFWLNHDHPEDSIQTENKSKTNAWEVQMVHALMRHIVRQGTYKSSDIAVLTPYTGQLQKMRAVMRDDFEIVLNDRDREALEDSEFALNDHQRSSATLEHGRPLETKQLSDFLRVATVNNFQGEEAKVVIVSLVRSNNQQNVGFLKTSNRINVLLSRAKHGMYLIGNADTCSTVNMWRTVLDLLRAKGSVVLNPADFADHSPEGGCTEACANHLDCGHSCQEWCHSEAMHNAMEYKQSCQRHHQPCNHPCQKGSCSEPCGKCMMKVDNVKLPCSHVHNGIICHMTQDLASITCDVLVSKQVPGCKHNVTVKCTQMCLRRMEDCTHACGRNSCEAYCKHTKCPHKCHEPCEPCIRTCGWSCEHQGACTMPCSAPCNRLPCDERCSKVLPCGHQCPSQCTSKLAENTDTTEIRKSEQLTAVRGAEHGESIALTKLYSDSNLNESPIVILGCGHVFTIEILDPAFNLQDVYEQDVQLARDVPHCPDCKLPIRLYHIQRYNRAMNKAVLDITVKEIVSSGQRELQGFGGKFNSFVPDYDIPDGHSQAAKSALEPANNHMDKFLEMRYGNILQMEQWVEALQHKTAMQSQPLNKLYQAILGVVAKNSPVDNALANSGCDQRIKSGGLLLRIKVQSLVLEDKFGIAWSVKDNYPVNTPSPKILGLSLVTQAQLFFSDCTNLIDSCNEHSLNKTAVEAILYYARIVRLSSGGAHENAKDLLESAMKLCQQPFKGAATLAKAVSLSLRLCSSPQDEVPKDDLDAIKSAMVIASAPGDFATQWYRCINGHPFAINERDTPKRGVRCPECGEAVGPRGRK